jgi:hypothetical protein
LLFIQGRVSSFFLFFAPNSGCAMGWRLRSRSVAWEERARRHGEEGQEMAD